MEKEDAAEEELVAASRIAQAAEFIDEKENRYDSDIARGAATSQADRNSALSPLRVHWLSRHRSTFLTTAFPRLTLRPTRRSGVRSNRETGESTVLIVAQRISTIMGAEQIIVLDEGRIVGKGTHRELLQNCAVYREIAQSQLSEEELEL